MNPDFISLRRDATVAEALEQIRRSDLSPQQISIVCVVDEGGKLLGALSLPDLLRADPQQKVGDLADAEALIPTVHAEADLPEVAQLMTDYNLIAMPVLDGEGKAVGVISVDDILELLLPEEWRRRAGAGRS
jgi:Mg/Co/Ni transporter MgtE